MYRDWYPQAQTDILHTIPEAGSLFFSLRDLPGEQRFVKEATGNKSMKIGKRGRLIVPHEGRPYCHQSAPDTAKVLVHAAVEQKLAVLNEVRETIEITQTGEYANFMRIFFPAFMHVLRTLPMSTTDDNNHKTRNTLLEILNR